MRDNPGGELDPADDVHRRSKNSPSVLSCIGKKTREGCNRGSEVGTVHSGRDQFLWGNRWNLAEERVVRKISSPKRKAGIFLIFAMTRSVSWEHEQGSAAPVLASESASSSPGSRAWPGTNWKLRATREERELVRSQISQKN